jgi:hypothetical protein
MSRITRADIWSYHVGAIVRETRCLCCRTAVIKRDAKKTESGHWVRGHVIHHKNQGPDIYENIRPICLDCNQKDKKYKDSYAYMVILGTMTQEERLKNIASIRKVAVKYFDNPELLQCTSYYEGRDIHRKHASSRRCPRRPRHPHTLTLTLTLTWSCQQNRYPRRENSRLESSHVAVFQYLQVGR